MQSHPIVARAQWIEARRQLLAKEKELTRLRDQLSQARRDLPWERVDKTYAFEGPNGTETLAQLFAGASQLPRRAQQTRRGARQHALMTVMFAVGVMSIAWTAALTALVAIEKMRAPESRTGRVAGAALIAWAFVILATAGR